MRKPNPFVLAPVFRRTVPFHSLYFGNGFGAIRRGSRLGFDGKAALARARLRLAERALAAR